MRTLLKLVLVLLIFGTLGLMGYVTFVETPNPQTTEMIEIPAERYADKL